MAFAFAYREHSVCARRHGIRARTVFARKNANDANMSFMLKIFAYFAFFADYNLLVANSNKIRVLHAILGPMPLKSADYEYSCDCR